MTDSEGWRQWYIPSMEMVETALGRMVLPGDRSTVLEDAILRLLFDYRLNPQNPNNAPMKLSDIARGVLTDLQLAQAHIDALKSDNPPLVEELDKLQQDRTFRISGHGVRFVRNIPQGSVSAAR